MERFDAPMEFSANETMIAKNKPNIAEHPIQSDFLGDMGAFTALSSNKIVG